MFGYFRERLQGTNGNQQAGVSVAILGFGSGSIPAEIYSWNSGTGQFTAISGATINTDSAGYYEFYATPGIYRAQATSVSFDRTICVPVPGVPFGYPDARPDGMAVADDTNPLQNEIFSLSRWNGGSGRGGTVYLAPRVYNVKNIILPNDVSLEGSDPSVSIIKQIDGEAGHVIASVATISSVTPNGGKHSIRRLQVDGSANGVFERVSTSLTTSTPRKVTVDSAADVLANYVIQGVGIPDKTQVTSVVGNDVTLSKNVTLTAASPVRILFRKAYNITITGIAGGTAGPTFSYTTSAGVGLIKAGMRVFHITSGTSTYVPDDFWIESITGTTVTFRRELNQTLTGTLDLCCYYYNCGIFVGEPGQYFDPGQTFDPTNTTREYRAPTLEQVQITNCSGDGLRCRKGRDQLHVLGGSKATENFGGGMDINSVNDSQIEGKTSLLTNWSSDLRLTTCATPRIIACDISDCVLQDKERDLEVIGCRQAHIFGGDLNGRAMVRGNSAEKNHGVRFSGMNFKWRSVDLLPVAVPYAEQFLSLDAGAQVVLESPYFYGDRFDNSAPNYLWTLSGNSTLLLDNMHLVTSGSVPERPYKVDLGSISADSQVFGWYIDMSSSSRVWLGGGFDKGVANNTNALAGSVGESLSFSIQESAPLSFTNNMSKVIAKADNLTPGDWEASGMLFFKCTSATITSLRAYLVGASTTIPSSVDPEKYGVNDSLNGAGSFSGTVAIPVGPFQLSLNVATTVNLIGKAMFSAGSVAGWGSCHFRRLR